MRGGVGGCPESRTAPFASPGRRHRSHARVQTDEGGARGARLAKLVPAARGEAAPPRQGDKRASLTVSSPQGSCSPQRAPERTKAPLSPPHHRGRPGGRRGTAQGGHAPAPTWARRRRRARPAPTAPPPTAGRAAREALAEELRGESVCCSEDPGPFHAVRQGRETESPAGCHTPPSTADRTKSGPVGHECPFLLRPGRAGHHHMDRWTG